MFGPFGGDPFRRNPFADVDRMFQSMFNDPFFGGNPFAPPPRAMHHPGLPQRPGGAPTIEELGPDDNVGLGPGSGSSQQPIVEEPEVEGDPNAARPGQRRRMHSPPPPAQRADARGLFDGLLGGSGGGGAQYMSFSSMTTSSMGSMGEGGGAVTYQETTSSRIGPGGVRETQRTVRDGRTGREEVTIARGLGDKERILTRSRDASGRETQNSVLRGIEESEAERFDAQWMERAEQSLGFGGGSRLLGGGLGGRRYQEPPPRHAALPASQPATPSTTRPAAHRGVSMPGSRYV